MSDKPFQLEPVPASSRIPVPTLNELVALRETAKAAGGDYTKAVEEQAKKYRVKKGALKRYIAALEADKLEELSKETADLSKLIRD